jgi:hypothetical protein
MSVPKIKDFSDYDQYEGEANSTTSEQAQEFFRNQNECLRCVMQNYWQPETNYDVDDEIFSPDMPKYAKAVCVKSGKSSTAEPSWGNVTGNNVSDGTCLWKLRYENWEKDIATDLEAKTGTVDNKIMTPAKTKQAIMELTPSLDESKGVLTVEKGGTGATTAKAACIKLGVYNDNGHLVLPDGSELWIE